MARVARSLNKVTKGKVLPVHITVLSLLGHIPAAWALYNCRPLLAAGLITVFGLMDSLDGALAREQKSASRLGMLFDSVTDRLKEILIYSTLAVYVAKHVPDAQPWLVAALAGTSILVSFVRARGEATMAGIDELDFEANKVFTDGLSRYEIRMAILVIGLISGFLAPLMMLMVALNLHTASMRFMQASRIIYQHENGKKTKKGIDKRH